MNKLLFDKTQDDVTQDHFKYLPDPSSSMIMDTVKISLISGMVRHPWVWLSMVKLVVKYEYFL